MDSMQNRGKILKNILFRSVIILIFVGLLAVPAAAEEVAPTAVRVNATYDETTPDYGVLNFSSIQTALDNVAAGGIVAVDEGTYNENLTVHQTVFLGTEAGAVIDAMGSGTGILIEADGVFVAGFTVTNATTYGIAGDRVNSLTIRNATVAVASDETTLEIPAGISLKEGTGHLIADNTVTVTSDLPKAAGIIASYVESSEISDNTISVEGARSADAPQNAGALHDPAAAPWDQAIGHETINALLTDAMYCELYGIVATGTDLAIDGNSIGVAATCLGGSVSKSDEKIFCQAFPRGVQADGESIEITDNIIEITSNATDDALGEGIMAMGELSLIEGNCIILETTGRAANPWGIGLYSVPKGRVLGNEITILVHADDIGQVHATTCGIGAHYSEKAQVLENTVTYTAYIGSGDASSLDASIEGIFVDNCYQSAVAENDVCVDITMLAGMSPIIFGSEGSGLSPTAAAVYADLTGQSIEGWTGSIGLHVDGSDETWVTENEIETVARFLSLNLASNVSEVNGGIMAAGLLIRNTADAVASGNTIEAGFGTGSWTLAIGDNSSVACTNLISQVFGLLLSETDDAEVSDNAIAVESTQTSMAISLATGAESGGLMEILDDEMAEDETEMNAFAVSLDEEGAYSESLWTNLNETALARTQLTALSAGIYANTGADTGIFDNTVDVGIVSSVMDRTIREVVAEDALTDVRGTVAGFGIIGPAGSDARISGNTVTVESAGHIMAISGEGEVNAESVRSQSQMHTTAHGIVGLAPENEISDNVVTVAALGEGETVAAFEAGQDEMEIARSRMTTRAVGITIRGVDQDSVNEVSGNTVNVLSILAPTAAAEGTAGDIGALIEGRATGVGIRAPLAEISGNTVGVLSRVENATAVAEEIAAQEARSETYALAIARGIVTRKATVTDNIVAAEGIATGTVVAGTEELLENARGDIFVGGIGIGIHDRALSTMTQNNLSGIGEASSYSSINGYRPEGFGIGFAEGLGIMTRGGTASYNNIDGAVLGEYTKDTPTRAAYNWWGDASGPSGYGPGTGSGIYGVIYYDDPMTWEPWLTRPYETVLETDTAYLGVELRSDDGLTEGWNTFSVPIDLEDTTWAAISSTGEGLNYSIAYTWDAAGQRWLQVLPSTRLNPLDAVYVRMNEDARLPVAVSPEITSPPVKYLKSGWNLIGPAYAFDAATPAWDTMKVDKALTSIEETPAGLTGYTLVLSPSINPEAWVYTAGANKPPTMATGYGYWVYMEKPDILAGFSSTPLPLPDVNPLAILV